MAVTFIINSLETLEELLGVEPGKRLRENTRVHDQIKHLKVCELVDHIGKEVSTKPLIRRTRSPLDEPASTRPKSRSTGLQVRKAISLKHKTCADPSFYDRHDTFPKSEWPQSIVAACGPGHGRGACRPSLGLAAEGDRPAARQADRRGRSSDRGKASSQRLAGAPPRAEIMGRGTVPVARKVARPEVV